MVAADAELIEADRRMPQDPALVQSAVGLASRTVPSWWRATRSTGRISDRLHEGSSEVGGGGTANWLSVGGIGGGATERRG